MLAGSLRLDEIYKMVAYIYSGQNAQRPPTATFAHFVEVCGMLTIHNRRKRKEGIKVEDALCKALGWFFPLLAKFKVTSLEEILFRKFPNVCPYCHQRPHNDAKCKSPKEPSRLDQDALTKAYLENCATKPRTIDEWQRMFGDIYPRTIKDLRTGRSILGLFEELGELAEAVRVFDRYPRYFAGEAADVFSYLMGIANENDLLTPKETGTQFSLEAEFLRRYPGLCLQCGYAVCVCPLVPEATVGRLAKELSFDSSDQLFAFDASTFDEASRIAARIIDKLGGYAGLSQQFPFDRGETNRALILLCLRLAESLEADNRPVAERLRSAAIKIGSAAANAGSRTRATELTAALDFIRESLISFESAVVKVAGRPEESAIGLVEHVLRRGPK